MNKVLISGAAGFVGSTLVPILLAQGFHVRAMDNMSRGDCDSLLPCATDPNFKFVRGDVTNQRDCEKAVEGVDAVVHLAALVGAPVCERNRHLASEVNITGTENLVEEAKHWNIPFFFASTGSVYGKVEGTCTEESPTNPLSVYGQTKLDAEQFVLAHDHGYAFRFATAYGVSPKMRLDLLPNELAYRAKKEGALVIYQADFRRTFIHVSDMANVFVFALNNYESFGDQHIFNGGWSGGNWTKRQLAEHLRNLTGCAVFYADEGYTDLDLRDYAVNYVKLANTGWCPCVSMSDGLESLVKAVDLLCPRNQYCQNA